MRRRTFLRVGALSAVPVGALRQAGRANAAATSCLLVAAGDMNHQSDTRATGALAVAHQPDVVATLGDQQYPTGSLTDYQATYAKTPWGQLKPRTRPVPGHHEYDTAGAEGYYAYFGVQTYYSYDIGMGWRGYALNSHINIAEQARWLKHDLARYPGVTVLASWSDPLYSSGTKHGGDRAMQPLWDALSGHKGVVLNGHEHNYERFAVRGGLRAFVAGTGGSATYPFGTPVAGSQVRITQVPGILVLTLRAGGAYSWAFKNTSGHTLDSGAG